MWRSTLSSKSSMMLRDGSLHGRAVRDLVPSHKALLIGVHHRLGIYVQRSSTDSHTATHGRPLITRVWEISDLQHRTSFSQSASSSTRVFPSILSPNISLAYSKPSHFLRGRTVFSSPLLPQRCQGYSTLSLPISSNPSLLPGRPSTN